jgi:hypothetical protein
MGWPLGSRGGGGACLRALGLRRGSPRAGNCPKRSGAGVQRECSTKCRAHADVKDAADDDVSVLASARWACCACTRMGVSWKGR